MAGRELDVDVVVVGAGLAGARTARLLHDAGLRVAVLEARERVGGRTLASAHRRGHLRSRRPMDRSGSSTAPWLVRELGIQTFATFTEGTKVLLDRDRRRTYRGEIPSLSIPQLLRMQLALMGLERERKRVPAADPTAARGAERLDAMTLETLRARYRLDHATRGAMDAAVRTIFGAEAADLSALYFLAYLNAGGGLMALAGTRGGAQEERLVGGVQQLSRRLLDGIEIHLDAPVEEVQVREGRVVLTTPHLRARARRAVFALPPTQLRNVAFDPVLPAGRRQLLDRAFMGSAVKMLALYDRPFWREAGLSGELVCGDGPLSVVFDNSSHDDRQPALVGFVVGRHARVLSTQDADTARRSVLDALVRAFGPAAGRPSELILQDWSAEPYVGGCPVALFGPGAFLPSSGHLRTPLGPLHFAGTETAREHIGYLEGALESAERVFSEVQSAGL
ncbi:MAG: FAD-dependent oxidoreductase [Polyangiales bacterium]